jgi:hypothetical protein
MRRNEPDDNKARRALPIVHPNAAAIDVGARMHVAAVGADRTAEPVRSFGTFTTHLHQLVVWFAECRVSTAARRARPISPSPRARVTSSCSRRWPILTASSAERGCGRWGSSWSLTGGERSPEKARA